MAESVNDKEELMRREYLAQTARIHWHELQTWYASGAVVKVAGDMNLVEVAVQLGMDNTALFKQWLDTGSVALVDDAQAVVWYEANEQLWAVVAAPWVLVQKRD